VPSDADARTVTHVLNRLGYGPRPGDVERVQAEGLAAYIEAQLHPERIANAALDERLAPFETLTMSTRQLADEYFEPANKARRQAQAQQTRQAQAGGDTMMATPPAPTATPAQADARRRRQDVNTQLMQAKVADMYVALQSARAYTYAVARSCDAGQTTRFDAAGAILLSSESAFRVAGEAVQALGGAGYTKDWPVERYLRDAKLLEIGAGTNEIRRMLIGRELIGAA